MNRNCTDYIRQWLENETRRKQSGLPETLELSGIRLSVHPEVFLPSPALTHSTPLLLKSVEQYSFRDKRVLDVGTGSGVLAIHAVLRGAKQVTATDISDCILDQASENALLNGISDIKFIRSNLFTHVTGRFDYIFANGPISVDAWLGIKLDGHTIESYGATLFAQYRDYLTENGRMFMTFAEFGRVPQFYQTLKKYHVVQKEIREYKFGIWWSFHEMFR